MGYTRSFAIIQRQMRSGCDIENAIEILAAMSVGMDEQRRVEFLSHADNFRQSQYAGIAAILRCNLFFRYEIHTVTE
ncbi:MULTISPECIES: hypothetical protein [Bradyrhizobium]|uniref:hypothetical protein n=1 Tax=Bradyrhizobium TaxID=374 RepID=UPI0003F5725D|nr:MULTISPECIES: hypothetical protein [Bradyrhizobium]UFW51495.1 hypothetical protein BaraCB756_11195 [Bradyrhizobium arachidis]